MQRGERTPAHREGIDHGVSSDARAQGRCRISEEIPVGESDSRRRNYQRGTHIYPRELATGVVLYAYIPRGKGVPPLRISLDTADPHEADRRLRAKVAELEAGDAEADVRRAATAGITLAEISIEYLDAPHGWTRRTTESERARVYAAGDWFEKKGVTYANQITRPLVDEWIRERGKVVGRRTINRDLRAWRGMLAWAHDGKLCDRCDAILDRKGLREAKRKKRYVVPDPDEMRAILAKLAELWDAKLMKARDRMAKQEGGRFPREGARECIAAIYTTGLRIDELRRLPPDALDCDGVLRMRPEAGPVATSEPGKGYREREIPLTVEGQVIMAEFFRLTQPRAGARGKITRKVKFSESWLVKELHRATDAINLPRCGLHDLRRAFATEAVRNGIDLLVVSKWLGHAEVRTTELYLATYRSDAKIVAPLPRGMREQSVSKPSAHVRENEAVPERAAEDGDASETAENQGSYPSGLNRRPAVYETDGDSRNDSGSEIALHTRANVIVRGDVATLDALARWQLDEEIGTDWRVN
jgi:site-specific recombinase XerD